MQGKVASIEKKTENGGSVLLEVRQRIPFDVLVLAPGSIWTGPIANEFIKNTFEKAESIVIAGRGAVGIGKAYLAWCSSLVHVSLQSSRERSRISGNARVLTVKPEKEGSG